MAGMKTRIEHINAEIEELNTLTKQRKREVDQAKNYDLATTSNT